MPTLIPLDNVLGAALIGVIVSTLIFGITCLQVYLYYTEHCERDGKFLKTFVAVVMLFDIVHAALLPIFLYHYAVTNFGDYAVLAKGTWSLLVQVVVASFLSAMVQSFYAYRIFRLSQNRLIIPLAIVLMCSAQFALSIVYTVKAFQVVFFSNIRVMEPYNTSGLSLDIACDSLIAISTIYYLQQKRTGLSSTTRAINKLIAYSLNTCLLTTVLTLASVIAWRMRAEELIGAAFYFVCVRLYSCSLMSILNSRDAVREEFGQKGSNLISLGALSTSIGFSSSADTMGRTSSGTDAEKADDKRQKVVLVGQPSQASVA